MRFLLNECKGTHHFDFSELDKKRPSLATRRLATLVLTRSLLAESKLISPQQAKKVTIHRLKSGKPFLKFYRNINYLLPSISLSHTGPWIACLLSDKKTQTGLDIEDITVNRPFKKLSEYAFSKEENEFVSQTGQLGFYKLWTTKEAIAKSRGKGLNDALKIDLGLQLAHPFSAAQAEVKIAEGNYHLFQQIIDHSLLLTIAHNTIYKK
ncbi:MAG: 4'-phosphopantetheinyl transferase superfamily protein [Alphaproteobacteria bacterium]|nr:4'-phosphopantetheinyl transferase superfamily protein [Alphaproteobacteria bacterium]